MEPSRTQCASESAIKYDESKTRFDLLPAHALERVACVYTYGASKYPAHNWRKGMEWSRVYAAIQRHLWAFWAGKNLDAESGLPHLAHAVFGCLSLLDYAVTCPENDDRRFYEPYDKVNPSQNAFTTVEQEKGVSFNVYR